ncbi:putative 50 kDa protein in type I retrotransposable element R1DM [Lucilia cuprina]|nr:putative 50 kDa protein in type I retrotransposable element R1DM [Lucilia cuprina]
MSKRAAAGVAGNLPNGPTLGVSVHELWPLRRSDAAVIRTPSVAERDKVAANENFGEVGLELSVNDKLGPKVVVQRAHPEITPDEFMGELYDLNFRRRMTPEEFKRSVRLVCNPWNSTGGPVSVILEGNNEAMQQLLDNGRCYIKWFSFMVRPHDAVPSCFRCLGFDHRVRECRMTEGVCRLCGQVGHLASRCVNEIHCRNCSFKGLPADHLMMSATRPVYSAMVARAKNAMDFINILQFNCQRSYAVMCELRQAMRVRGATFALAGGCTVVY